MKCQTHWVIIFFLETNVADGRGDDSRGQVVVKLYPPKRRLEVLTPVPADLTLWEVGSLRTIPGAALIPYDWVLKRRADTQEDST